MIMRDELIPRVEGIIEEKMHWLKQNFKLLSQSKMANEMYERTKMYTFHS